MLVWNIKMIPLQQKHTLRTNDRPNFINNNMACSQRLCLFLKWCRVALEIINAAGKLIIQLI